MRSVRGVVRGVSGRRALPGWLARLFGAGGRSVSTVDPADPSLVVVASTRDDVESCSALLERAAAEPPRFVPGAPALTRHRLALRPSDITAVAETVAEAGYIRDPRDGQAPVSGEPVDTIEYGGPPESEPSVIVSFVRVESVDALHVAQERARMAGLAQRHGGEVLGWEALQPAATVHPDAATRG